MTRHLGIAILFAALIPCRPLPAFAQVYPDHPVRIIVPYAAGGGVDIAARLLTQQLTEQLRQTFLVEDRPGGTGVVGSQVVAGARPDGYTLLYAATAEAIIPSLAGGVSFDVERELTPITLVVSTPFVMVINPKIPANTPSELVAYIKQHPDGFRWGLGGLGSPDHMAIAQFDQQAGIHPLTVPYQGGGPAIVATLSGEVDGIMDPPSLVKSYVASGQLRGLGISSAAASPVMPEMPPIAGAGYPGYQSATWYGLWGPKAMPKQLALAIRQFVVAAMAAPAFRDRLLATALVPEGSDPDAFAAYFKTEIEKYRRLIKDSNIQIRQGPN
jgi:tripartite-type tricarboxylate transporter receptor subunit TctC